MSNLYENIVIGNFLYGLGFEVSRKLNTSNFPSLINLLQQTPDDQALGDLVIGYPGIWRVIEFKQRSNRSDKELDRLKKLLITLSGRHSMMNVSRHIHWYVETWPEKDSFQARVVPYLDAFNSNEDVMGFAEFIAETAKAAINPKHNFTYHEQRAYLKILATCHKDSGTRSSGILLNVNGNGSLGFTELISFSDLLLSSKEILQKQIDVQHQNVKSQEYGFNQKGRAGGIER